MEYTHTRLIGRDGHILQQRAMVIYMKIWVTLNFSATVAVNKSSKKFSDLSSKHLFLSLVVCLTTGWPCIIFHGAQLDSGLRRVQICCTCIHIHQGQAWPRAYYFHGWPRSKRVQAKPHKNQNYSEVIEQTKSKLYPWSMQKECVLYPKGYGEVGKWKTHYQLIQICEHKKML